MLRSVFAQKATAVWQNAKAYSFYWREYKVSIEIEKTNSDLDYHCLRKQELNRSLKQPTFFLLKHPNINTSYKLDENGKKNKQTKILS